MIESDQARDWQDLIVDHSQFPRRHGKIDPCTHQAEGENPLCGDRVRLYLDVDADDIIREIRFEATGCAISLASASMLSDAVHGQHIEQAGRLFEQAHARLTKSGDMAVPLPGDLNALELISQFPLRVKCASLCWHVLRQALTGTNEPVTTE